jgi:prefoldin alpha subunit
LSFSCRGLYDKELCQFSGATVQKSPSYHRASLGNVRETTAAIESIKTLSQKPESETLVPIGIGTYVPTKILSNSKIVLSIGAGVAVEKDFPSAINYLEAHIKEIEVALQDNTAKKQDAAARLEQGREQINQLMQSVSKPKSG